MTTTMTTMPTTYTIEYDFDKTWLLVKTDEKTIEINLVNSAAFNNEEMALVNTLLSFDIGSKAALSDKEMSLVVSASKKIDVEKHSASQIVQHVEGAKISERTIENTEVRIARLQEVINNISADGYVMLVYDIPTDKNDVCPNPSGMLWRYGFRMNLSCWVIPTRNMERARIKEELALWDANKIKWHVVPYADSAMDQIRGIAQEKLDEEVRRVHTSFIEMIATADETLKEKYAEFDAIVKEGGEVTTKQREKVESLRDNRVRTILRQAAERLNAAIECAEAFDTTEQLADLLRGIKTAHESYVLAFNADAKQKRIKPATSV